MSYPSLASRGAAPVGTIDHLDEEGRMVVALMRGNHGHWEDDLARVFGQMMGIVQSHGRRALLHHSKTCSCLGADEATIVELVRRAGSGARSDATLMALMLVSAEVAPLMVSMAEQLALLIRLDIRIGSGPFH